MTERNETPRRELSRGENAVVDEMQRVQDQLLRAAWAESNRRTIRASSRTRREEPPAA